MDSLRKIVLLMLATVSFGSFAEESCTSMVSTEQQCSFDIPVLKHGDSVIVKANNSPLFTGSITAQCRFGTVSLSSESCAPKSVDDCAIPSTNWGPSYNQCSHETQTKTVKNGKVSTINDISGQGSVTYSCSLGKLSVDDSACEKVAPVTDFDAKVTSQSTVMNTCASSGKGSSESCLLWANSCDSGVIESGLIEVPVGTSLSENKIFLSTCGLLGFSKMDSYTSPRREDMTGSVNYYSLRATCSGYTGAEPLLESCGVTPPPVVTPPPAADPCKGEQVSTLSIVPKICEGSGASQVCYKNTCAVEPAEPEACLDCVGTYRFTDPSTGNACNVNMGGLASELSDTISFRNSQFNGVANVSCSNGVASGGGTCFKSCASGTIVSWKDKNGVSSCGQVIPNNAGGFYKQGDKVTLSTSLDNTGSASATCNNGNWEVTGASCKLSCSGSVAWGSGVDALGRNKSNLCSANAPTVKNGGSTSVSNITSNATGSVGLTCNDGTWSKNNPVCNTSCSAQAVSWGGACQATSAEKSNGQSQYVVHTGNSAHPYPWSISGNATASCSDGKVTVSGTCRYLVSQTMSTWGTWNETGRACSVSPDATTVPRGTPFNQTTSCNISESRTRYGNNNWSDGSVEVTSPQTETRNYVDTSTKTALGQSSYFFWSTPVVIDKLYGNKTPYCQLSFSPYKQALSGQCFVEGAVNEYSVIDNTECSFATYEQICVASEGTVDIVVDSDYRVSFEFGGWSCSGWAPNANTVNSGTQFQQTSTCTRNTVLGYDRYMLFASGKKTLVGRTFTGSRLDSRNDYQYAIGTKAKALIWSGTKKTAESTTLMSQMIRRFPPASNGIYDGSPTSKSCSTEGEVYTYYILNYGYQVPSPMALVVMSTYEVVCSGLY
jgi:hypothetical protein